MAKHKNNNYKAKQSQKNAGTSDQTTHLNQGGKSTSSKSTDASDRSGYSNTKKNQCGY